MIYQMKCSFDNINWYQLEWSDVDFRDFENVYHKCNNIEELESKIFETFPKSDLKYNYIGERNRKISVQTKKTKKRK